MIPEGDYENENESRNVSTHLASSIANGRENEFGHDNKTERIITTRMRKFIAMCVMYVLLVSRKAVSLSVQDGRMVVIEMAVRVRHKIIIIHGSNNKTVAIEGKHGDASAVVAVAAAAAASAHEKM